jgi:hypothetical protein
MGISIKEPCHEDWAKMTATEKGAFCQKCALEVSDFTNKSSFEIKQLLVQEFAQNDRTCARISNFQLDQLNDEFFQWKNERDNFRAVWIFSLVAVFGLTLFSCQNTLSKEMISQLNAETTALLNHDTTEINLPLVDSKLTLSDSSLIQPNPPIYFKLPVGEIVTYMGIMPYYEPYQPWITCTVSLGSIAISGSVTADTSATQFLKATALIPANPATPFVQPTHPIPPSSPKPSSRIEGIVGAGEKKFDAFVSPNPISTESRVFIHAKESLFLFVDLFQENETSALRSGSIELAAGDYQLDLKLYNLPSGNYQLNLQASYQLSVLDFMV